MLSNKFPKWIAVISLAFRSTARDLPRLSLEVVEDIAFAGLGDGDAFVVKDADFKIAGRVAGNPQVDAGAKLSPGFSPGDGIIDGNLALMDTGTLFVELAGAERGVTYDFLELAPDFAIASGSLARECRTTSMLVSRTRCSDGARA